MGRDRGGHTVVAVLVGLLAACAPRAAPLPWDVTFATPLLAARAVRVEASVHDGTDCSGATRYAASISRLDRAPAPPLLAPGTYTLCADAIDDGCNVFATGQTTVDLHVASMRVAVLLASSAPAPACPGSACAHGDCTDVDAGRPADGAVPDAAAIDAGGIDAGAADAGCAEYVIAPPTAPACQSSTRACVGTCADQACYDACIAADPSAAACRVCVDDAYDSCANAAACQPAWNVLVCCSNACPVPAAASCCPSEYHAWGACTAAQSLICGAAEDICFL